MKKKRPFVASLYHDHEKDATYCFEKWRKGTQKGIN